MKPLSFHILIATMTVVLSACGGGGGGGGNESSPSPDSDAVDLSDGSSYEENQSVTFKVDGAKEMSASQAGQGTEASAQQSSPVSKYIDISRVADGVFEVAIGKLPFPLKVTLRALDGEGNPIQSVTIDIENTSGEAVEGEASLIANSTESVIDLPEDRRYFAHVLDLLYLRGDITHSEKQSLLSEYDSRSEAFKTILKDNADRVRDTLSSYRDAQSTEDELEAATDTFESYMQDAGDSNLTNLENLPDAASDFAPDLASTEIAYNTDAGGYSRFYGQSLFGQTTDSGFRFDDQHKWLREIAQGSGAVMCNVQPSTSS